MTMTKGLSFLVGFVAIICCSRLVTVASAEEAKVTDAGDIKMQEPRLGEDHDSSLVDAAEWSILKELFPDTLESISNAWERQPTFLPGTLESAAQSTALSTLKPKEPAPHRFAHLFHVSNLGTVLSDPNLVHGSDYAVLKYIERDGEEWSGKFPYEKIPLDHIAHLLTEKAFSVVINKLQERWLPVAQFSRALEQETQCHGVSCNLYLTPPGGARGFESHLDWMDVLVVQVVGIKDWSVWTEPFIETVMPDEKRKPTRLELKAKSPASVRLFPGDALYIPRGYLHNATTPHDSQDVSLHLTFGIEHLCETTMEALLHHALHLYVHSQHSKKLAKSIAIPVSGTCSVIEGFQAGDGITYETLLHLAMSEVVRRTNCGGFGEATENARGDDYAAICRLRRSMPLHPQFQQTRERSDQEVQEQYIAGLNVVVSHLSASHATRFLNKVTAKPDPTANAATYCFPYAMLQDYAYQCNPEAIPASTQAQLQQFAKAYLEFARDKFEEARTQLAASNAQYHVDKWSGVDWTQVNQQ